MREAESERESEKGRQRERERNRQTPGERETKRVRGSREFKKNSEVSDMLFCDSVTHILVFVFVSLAVLALLRSLPISLSHSVSLPLTHSVSFFALFVCSFFLLNISQCFQIYAMIFPTKRLFVVNFFVALRVYASVKIRLLFIVYLTCITHIKMTDCFVSNFEQTLHIEPIQNLKFLKAKSVEEKRQYR